jgi:hypothetical protein
MSEASYKKFQLYCNNCHWKRLTDGGDIKDLYEIKTSPVPTGIPIFDPETKKTYEYCRDGKPGPWTQKLYDRLIAIQYGDEPDRSGWITIVD